ncbi:unnamed protein product [Arabidopsis lyrata]|nr:unnamed protein product [Arabidopsis lyrata]
MNCNFLQIGNSEEGQVFKVGNSERWISGTERKTHAQPEIIYAPIFQN